MGRPRRKDTHLPKCVHPKHGAYYLVKGGKWTHLGRDLAKALAEYARRFEAPKEGGMAALIEEAFPIVTRGLADTTKAQYRSAANRAKEGLIEFNPDQVRQKDVRRVRREMQDTPNMANQVVSFLKLVFRYAVDEELIDSNPAIGIEQFKEAKRERLISMVEYRRIYAVADPQLQVVMDLLYLTAQRVEDVLTLRLDAVAPEGVYFRQKKTDARLRIAMNPDLQDALDRAKALHGPVRGLTVLLGRGGKVPGIKTIRERWNAACALAGVQDAQLRDLRAMSGTATKAQGKSAQAVLGHTTEKHTDRYLRDKQVPLVEGPSFGQQIPLKKKDANNQ